MGIQLHVMLLVLVELCSYCQVCVYVCVCCGMLVCGCSMHRSFFFSFSFFFFFFLWWRKEVDKIV